MAILDTPQPDLSLEELRFLVTVAGNTAPM